MCKEIKIKKLPKGTKIPLVFVRNYGMDYNKSCFDEVVGKQSEYVIEDAGGVDYDVRSIVKAKLRMLWYVRDGLKQDGLEFDCFNGLPPTRANLYKAYEFSAVWVWEEIIRLVQDTNGDFPETWYKKYRGVLASVMKKYPKITGVLISIADLHVPGNKLLDNSKMEDADFDNDHTDEGLADDKAEEFKTWILKWCDNATEKDKMRVRNWFQTKKSHKQIFAEINKVVGNRHKFNSRLALFVERLFNQDGLDYFFEKTGFDSKEDMFMAYFDKLTDFDEETKKSFIKKYLLA